ncbi:MAG: hypothetical protein ABWX71_00290 [Aeromicrobium sp.]
MRRHDRDAAMGSGQMRTKLGWALSVLGVLVAVFGAAVMVLLGPDSRFTTGPHAIETDDSAVVTAPKVITWADVQVDVLAEVPVRKPIFVGLGNSVDVADFVRRTGRLEVTSFTTPWKLTTRNVKGTANLPGAPTAVDWWIASSAGLGGASISTRLPDETVSLAILSVGSSNLAGLEVTMAYGVEGGFAKGVGLLLLGIGTVWLGLLVRRGRDEDWDDEDEEDVVYVYVDEHGVEHEITAEEAGDFEVVEEVVVEKSASEPTPEPARDTDSVAPTRPVPSAPGVLTAADIAATTPAPDPTPEPEQVLYVYVDEDGVEHEVSEAELAAFEIVDEEEES